MSSIDLIEENKRLSKELLFANQCLNVLIEFKTFVDSVFESILEQNLNENQCKKYKEINKRVFEVFSKRGNDLNPISVKTELNGESDDNIVSIKTQNGEDVSEETILDTNSCEEYNIKEDTNSNETNDCLYFGSELLRQKWTEECVANNSASDFKDSINKSLVCDDIGCQFQTKSPIILKHHKQLNHSKKFVCSYSDCQFKTCTKYSLIRHEKTHKLKVNSEETTRLTKDQTISRPNSLTNHKQIHSKKKFVCNYPECEYKTYNKSALNIHVKTHKPNKKVQKEVGLTPEIDLRQWLRVVDKYIEYVCDFDGCQYVSRLRPHFISHINGHKGLKPYQCPHCDLSFASEMNRKQHFKRKHKLSETALICQIDGCGRQYSTEHAFRKHQSDYHREKRFVCDFPDCEHRCHSAKMLESHKSVHGLERPIKCTVEDCPKTFSFESQLKLHMVLHTSERNHKCPQKGCDKTFKNEYSVRTHVEQVHGDKKFECQWPGCDYQVSTQAGLTIHLLSHSEDRRFECDCNGCDFKAKSKVALNHHKRRIHSDLRPHPCSWPGCAYSAKTREAINNHMVVHTNERKYVCDWKGCKHKSKTSGAMMYHKRTHTNERPFVCPKPGCDYSSSTNSNLTAHMQRIHNK